MNASYKGPERRESIFTESDLATLANAIRPRDPKVFGFRLQELFVIATVAFGIFAFYIRTNDTLAGFSTFKTYTIDYMANSDAYHSEVLGTYFRQGKPTADNFDAKRIREILNGSTYKS